MLMTIILMSLTHTASPLPSSSLFSFLAGQLFDFGLAKALPKDKTHRSVYSMTGGTG